MQTYTNEHTKVYLDNIQKIMWFWKIRASSIEKLFIGISRISVLRNLSYIGWLSHSIESDRGFPRIRCTSLHGKFSIHTNLLERITFCFYYATKQTKFPKQKISSKIITLLQFVLENINMFQQLQAKCTKLSNLFNPRILQLVGSHNDININLASNQISLTKFWHK